MTGPRITHYATTGLIALAMAASSFFYLSGGMDADLAVLGYPRHFVVLLGSWKGLAAIALLAPGFPKVTEWAYAGLFFTLTGAAVAHGAVEGLTAHVAPPLVMLGLLAASYATRSAVHGSAGEAAFA